MATYNTAENSIIHGTAKQKIQSNRHDILLGQIQNTKKSFPHIMGIGREKPVRFYHKTPPILAPEK